MAIGYETPTPIQEKTISVAIEGNDVLGIAQTGTGKTAAFCLPMIHLLSTQQRKRLPKSPRSLILTPTRELAIQIEQSLREYGQFLPLKYAVIFGGVSQGKQVSALRGGVDVLVATPGRLLDLINQEHLRLDKIEIFVLDEADRMLDMGFIRDIQKVLPLLPKKRQSLFFSATMPPAIQKLSAGILNNPKKVEVTPPATTVERISQSAMFVDKEKKIELLIHLLKSGKVSKTLVFVEMKHIANKVAKKLLDAGISATAIHGNKTQGARQRALQDFSVGNADVLVATEIAARGIDIDGISHVINFELSHLAESYVHRIGRTARAGADGAAISLVTAEEKSYLANIERVTRQEIPIDESHPFHSKEAMNAPLMKVGKAKAKLEGRRRNTHLSAKSNNKSNTKPSAKKNAPPRRRHRNKTRNERPQREI